ncbi:MAG: glutamate synthase large subunit [Immundisolibacteraceae bacterium]|nr:glutamate synthase large subunit [Immundisolibacteraceae bacterium]
MYNRTPHNGLYRPEFEHDSCGFGLIAQMDGVVSHSLVQSAIDSLARLTHRGAIAADGKTGDGCGLLIRKPDGFLRAVAAESDIKLEELYAAGVVFLNSDETLASRARDELNQQLANEGLTVAGWRVVPVNPSALGEQATRSQPQIEQVFVNGDADMDEVDFNRHLYFARRRTEKVLADDDSFFVTALSCHVISYKGLVMPARLPELFPDLGDPRFTSSICIYHQRFSTNTSPSWKLAQPFRYLAHNGEINTVQGNRFWAQARGSKFASPLFDNVDDILPVVNSGGSDSQSLDNMLDVLLSGGMDIFRAMQLMIPPAWQNDPHMGEDLRASHRYHSMISEPWDGPAGIVLTDGRYAACRTDRNGLRPARWVITTDRTITLASETGVIDYPPEQVLRKGRLKPGEMLAVDTWTGELLMPADINRMLAQRHPYESWLKQHSHYLTDIDCAAKSQAEFGEGIHGDSLRTYEKFFNLTYEELTQVLRPLADNGQEATGSMGDDTPMAVLSRQVRSIYDYFRQSFAQVTNPPIDPLRENIVMSLTTNFGRFRNVFDEIPEHAAKVTTDTPVLSRRAFHQMQALDQLGLSAEMIDLHYRPLDDGSVLQQVIEGICSRAEEAIRAGKTIIILSDRNLDREQIPVPALMATGAVHHHLTRLGIRGDAQVVVETGSARDPHQIATLIGFGATAVYPFLALAAVEQIAEGEQKDPQIACANYIKGINKALFKIMSKMGISTIASYRGAQLFEAVGIHDEVVNPCFEGVTSRISGSRFIDFENDQRHLARNAWKARKVVEQGGLLKYVHGGEYHAYNPDIVRALHGAVRTGEQRYYDEFASLVNHRPPATMRDLIGISSDQTPIPLSDVEPLEAIIQRFDSAGMSLGALSPEAHESLAIAMNRLGGRSNSGEGGESIDRYGNERTSKIKQVASGRFGVTPHYLVNAEVLQIKIAQGAKPGEGGQLPGDKVNDLIATLRYTRPGVTLISPPPHHDIYSIEDLAQLIFDLKQVNPEALVSVKLVAQAGIGTIAAGVAKAYADLITISGYDGGTAASPLTSVKYAGIPFEMGLAETHQTLRLNDLRDKVRIQADGGMKTGLDVIKAALLGAESFGFGTAPMVALGCKYLRICHLNNCATGVATQNDELRKEHYHGLPEMVETYFRFVIEETRQIMASLGISTMEALIGRTDLLHLLPGETDKQGHLDLSPVLTVDESALGKPQFCSSPRNEPFDKGEKAEQMVNDTLEAIDNKLGGIFNYEVQNIDRSIGARISGEIAKRYGNLGMADCPITLKLRGTAGQSLGVWNAGGLNLELEGDANDYVGKGMAGGQLVLYPPRASLFKSHQTTIMGNTCLYGATGGTLYAAGLAGERFGVRNSGARAVVEGIGDHGCEYMTGGVVTILGPTGINFGAGMTGGFAFVYEPELEHADHGFETKVNHELVEIHRMDGRVGDSQTARYAAFLRDEITRFTAATGSDWGQEFLDNFAERLPGFWLVKPKISEFETMLEQVV